MYTVYLNNRKAAKQTFSTYERARQFIRKQIRAGVDSDTYNKTLMLLQEDGLVRDATNSAFGVGVWDRISRNPTAFTHLGFEIRRG